MAGGCSSVCYALQIADVAFANIAASRACAYGCYRATDMAFFENPIDVVAVRCLAAGWLVREASRLKKVKSHMRRGAAIGIYMRRVFAVTLAGHVEIQPKSAHGRAMPAALALKMVRPWLSVSACALLYPARASRREAPLPAAPFR